jgi:Zn-dependent peptidase ImmA (M78 family)
MDKIKKAVKELLSDCKIIKPPVPVERIAQFLEATIIYEPFKGQDDISGMLFRDEKTRIIGINSSHHENRQRFSIAHEIGHLFLHEKEMFIDKVVKVNFRDSRSSMAIDFEEIEANAFAAELLMPSEFVQKEINKLLNQKDSHYFDKDTLISSLAKIFQVSTISMEYRLNNLGIITSQ